MKRIYKELLLAVFLGMVVPGIVLGTAVEYGKRIEIPSVPAVTETKSRTVRN